MIGFSSVLIVSYGLYRFKFAYLEARTSPLSCCCNVCSYCVCYKLRAVRCKYAPNYSYVRCAFRFNLLFCLLPSYKDLKWLLHYKIATGPNVSISKPLIRSIHISHTPKVYWQLVYENVRRQENDNCQYWKWPFGEIIPKFNYTYKRLSSWSVFDEWLHLTNWPVIRLHLYSIVVLFANAVPYNV